MAKKADESINLEQLLQMGITAAKRGNREGARVLFQQVLEADRKNDRAWVWLASVSDSPEKRQQYLQNALRINPNSRAAKKALQQMVRRQRSSEQQTLRTGMLVLLAVLVVAALLCLIAVAATQL